MLPQKINCLAQKRSGEAQGGQNSCAQLFSLFVGGHFDATKIVPLPALTPSVPPLMVYPIEMSFQVCALDVIWPSPDSLAVHFSWTRYLARSSEH